MNKDCSKIILVFFNLFLFASCSYIFEINENNIVLSSQDKDFVTDTGYFNRSQIEFSNLAVSKTSNASILQFGTSMIEIHNNAQNDLKNMVSSKNILVPDTLDTFPEQHYNILSAIEGIHFDSAYIHHQIIGIQDYLKINQNQIDTGTDRDLISYAEQYLPVLNENLNQAIILRDELRNSLE